MRKMEKEEIKQILEKMGIKKAEIEDIEDRRLFKIVIPASIFVSDFGELLGELGINRRSCSIEGGKVSMFKMKEQKEVKNGKPY